MRTLVSLVERRRQLVGDQNRLTNRLCDMLKQYYPQALEWFDDRGTVLFCDFLERWPTLRSVQQARTAVLETFFHAHHCRSASLISARIESIRSAAALTDDPAIIGPCRLHVLALVAQLRTVLAAITQFDREIAAVVHTLPDYALFEDLPGAGACLAPRLLAAFGEQRERFRNADEPQKYAGIAPVTERSGKKSGVHWRTVSEIPAPDLRGMGRPDHHPVILGGRLLPAAAREGQLAPHRCEGPRIQVDPHPVSMLADAHAVQRDCLPQRARETRFAPSRQAGRFGQDGFLLSYLIGASRAAARQAEGEACGEPGGQRRNRRQASCPQPRAVGSAVVHGRAQDDSRSEM